MIKNKLKNWLKARPALWQSYSRIKLFTRHVVLLRYHVYDLANTFKYMYWPVQESRDIEIIKAELIFQFHKLEKGLVMPGKRRLFGESIVVRVLKLLTIWHDRNYSLEDSVYLGAVGAIESYQHKIRGDGFAEECRVLDEVDDFLNGSVKTKKAVIKTPVPLVNNFSGGYAEFMRLVSFRRSVREFSSQEVGRALLVNAVKAAQQSPSVCNRQASKIYFYSDRKKIDELLSFQNGNKGFGHLVPCLAVVTVDQKLFFNATERNEPFIDGGLFTMSFLYGLSSQGMVSCCLNWCVSPSVDKKVHGVADIPSSERIMMFIAVGYPVNAIKVPTSARKNTSDVVTFKD